MFGSLYRRVRGALDVVHSYYSPAAEDSAEASPAPDVGRLVAGMRRLPDLAPAEAAAAEAALDEALGSALAAGRLRPDATLDGYALLQHAVAARAPRLVARLAGAGAAVAGHACSPPLHLAARLGAADLCALLLRLGARPDAAAPVCFPAPHAAATACHRLGLPRLLRAAGGRDCGAEERRLPAYHAVAADRADILALLLAPPHRVWAALYPLQRLFAEACQLGAAACVRLLVARFRVVDELGSNGDLARADGVVHDAEPVLRLNELDADGYSPFHYAVGASAELTRLLVELGADVGRVSARGETALHLLFRRLASPPARVAERARLLLGSGLEPLVNQQDWERCSALHRLVHHVNNNVRYVALADPASAEAVLAAAVPGQQEAYQAEILECLELLLSHNCNPALTNWQGLTPFHALFRAFSSFLSHDVDPNFLDIHHYFYIFDMEVFARAIQLFLRNSSDPNERPPDGQLPLKVMLHGILNISPVQYFKFRPGYLHCLQVLCEGGADCNFKLQNNQGTCITLVAALAESVLNTVGVGAYSYDRAAKEANAQFIDDILRCLLAHGLDPNHVSKRRRSSMELAGDGSGNALAEFVNLACMIAETQDLRFLHRWLVTLLQFGADPDVEPFPAEATICHSQSSIFLRHVRTQPINQLLHLMRHSRAARLAASPHAQRLLLLLHNVTSHEPLHAALHAFLARLQREMPGAAEHAGPLLRLLNPLAANPLSLKQLARVAVYRGLHRRLHGRVAQLDIPRELVTYLMDAELS